MSTSIWATVTTTDLPRATEFYTALGFTTDPHFTDDHATCVVIDEGVYVMVAVRDFFATMTDKQVVDPRTHVQMAVSLTRDSREEVDAIVERGLAAGGTEPRPAQDYGFMYSRDLDDLDGNNLGFLYMTPEALQDGPAAAAEHGASA